MEFIRRKGRVIQYHGQVQVPDWFVHHWNTNRSDTMAINQTLLLVWNAWKVDGAFSLRYLRNINS
jgi:hypothetical protein